VDAGKPANALAFYYVPPPPPAEVECIDIVKGIQQIIIDGGPLLVAWQWKAIQVSLANCVNEGYVTKAEANSLIAGYDNMVKNKGGGPGPPHGP
jgi:hypothetical protein